MAVFDKINLGFYLYPQIGNGVADDVPQHPPKRARVGCIRRTHHLQHAGALFRSNSTSLGSYGVENEDHIARRGSWSLVVTTESVSWIDHMPRRCHETMQTSYPTINQLIH